MARINDLTRENTYIKTVSEDWGKSKMNRLFSGTNKRNAAIIVLIVLFCSIIVPLLLEILVFRNKVPSALTNGEWGGFLGSYLGGIISGVGTLIAVYITTMETRKIQKQAQKNFDNDKRAQLENQRKMFTDDISVIVSEYITDITRYFHANRSSLVIEDEKYNLNREIEQKDKEIKKNPHSIQILKNEKETLLYKRDLKEKEGEGKSHKRTIALQKYYLLKIKLDGIDLSSELMHQLNDIHNIHAHKNISVKDFENETDKLIEILTVFSKKYIES